MSIDKAKQTVEVVTTIMLVAKDTPELREAGSELAKSALTLTKAINVCLLPIAAVTFAFDKGRKYFESKFEHDLEEVMKDVPQEDIVEPKASLVAPALQGLAFSSDEPNLKELYLRLIRSSMTRQKTDDVHPSFQILLGSWTLLRRAFSIALLLGRQIEQLLRLLLVSRIQVVSIG